jgi:hypothetical protein
METSQHFTISGVLVDGDNIRQTFRFQTRKKILPHKARSSSNYNFSVLHRDLNGEIFRRPRGFDIRGVCEALVELVLRLKPVSFTKVTRPACPKFEMPFPQPLRYVESDHDYPLNIHPEVGTG